MAEPKESPLMEKIVSLCKRRGFIYQSSEIYGGINGFWDYGPLGAELKRNVKELWWNTMTRQREDVVGLDATIIMSPQIWKASGHVDTFADLMVECPLTNRRFRADQIEPQSGTAYFFETAMEASVEIEIIRETLANAEAGGQTENMLRSWPSIHADKAKAKSLIEKSCLSSRDLEEIKERYRRTYPEHDSRHRGSFSRPFAVLIQSGKNPDSAYKRAEEFYRKQGLLGVLFLGPARAMEIRDSQEFNPENGVKLTEPRPFNLMFKTHYGPVESDENIAYLRPETAQAIFAQFKNVLDSSRVKVPFGIAQIGKAFRNEVTPRNFTFRSREFEQMELEFFIKPDEVIEAIHGAVATLEAQDHTSKMPDPQPNWGWQAWHRYWVEERVRFYEGIGLSRQTLGFHIQTAEELAHYARACTDILFKFPFSKRDEKGELKGEELEGIAARSDFDLSQHARFSGKPMGVFDEELRAAWGKLPKEKQDVLWRRYYENRKKYLIKTAKPDETPEQIEKQATDDANGLAKGQYIPHVIEPSAGADRLVLALLTNAYSETTTTDDKGKSETSVMLKFHPRVAPIKVGVMPLLKNKPDLVKKATEVRDLLRPWMNAFYDDGGSIGRRYARQDEIGTPFCVTIDFDTLGEKQELLNTVTIRHRDDGKQERLPIGELLNWLLARIR
ncbi:MAG: glycine--tRNA ligase [Verrucomicrobia bacterium]|nr:glycine--tRNA ligase [Verrucomicrobiota bacterium]